jgi:glycosyltransferase involved in cell wall biosynthesis
VTTGEQSCPDRVIVIGSGWLFASGITHYTCRLSSALAGVYDVGALLMRRLVPRRLYPGRDHVGAAVASAVVYPANVPVYDGVDWYWGPSLTHALRYLDRQRPTVLILQWWTGAVLHSYLRLARYGARRGARVILEWHEGQDVGEAGLLGTRHYVRALMPRLLALVDAHVVHSSYDLQAIAKEYSLGDTLVRVIPHGPYDHLVRPRVTPADLEGQGPFRLLYIGVVRPFKGVEDLVAAFSALERDQARQFGLSVVGETWEGWTVPDEAIARSPHADLIERVDRYVTDAELTAYVARADAVVLPYHRSSMSGPLHVAMAAGLPVVVTAVGGLVEAVRDYAGAVLVPPRDPMALRDALLQLPARRGKRYSNPHTWQATVDTYRALINELHQTEPRGGRQVTSAAGADREGAESGSYDGAAAQLPTVSVIIPAFSMKRWAHLCEAIASVRAQSVPVLETIVVIDHNPGLLAQARLEFPGVTVLANAGVPGASATRNTGVAASCGEMVAFLDDDAVASPHWLAALLSHFTDASVVGVGGRLEPLWATSRPRWFPPEFDWAVGASYLGMPKSAETVRNVWSNNMAVRRRVFNTIGGFRSDFGKVGVRSRPEDTDLCLRAGGTWIYEPMGAAGHRVPAERVTLRYFALRCFNEGWGKAALAALNGMGESISTERRYTRRVLPAGVGRGLREACRGEAAGGLRSLAIIAGFTVVVIGFLCGRVAMIVSAHGVRGRRPASVPVKSKELTL